MEPLAGFSTCARWKKARLSPLFQEALPACLCRALQPSWLCSLAPGHSLTCSWCHHLHGCKAVWGTDRARPPSDTPPGCPKDGWSSRRPPSYPAREAGRPPLAQLQLDCMFLEARAGEAVSHTPGSRYTPGRCLPRDILSIRVLLPNPSVQGMPAGEPSRLISAHPRPGTAGLGAGGDSLGLLQ